MNLRRLFKEVEEMLGQMLRKKEAEQIFIEDEERQQKFLQSLIEWQKKKQTQKNEKRSSFLNLQESLLKTVNKLNFFVFRSFPYTQDLLLLILSL